MWRIFSANSLAPSRPSPSLSRQHLLAEVALEALHLSPRTLGGGPQPWQHGGDGRIVGFRLLGHRQRLVGELDHTRQLFERLLGVEACHRPVPDRPDLLDCSIDHGLEPVEPSRDRGEPLRQRCEFPGDESEQAAAQEVDPFERAPGFLAQIKVREAHRIELLDEQIAIDGVVGWQVREPAELGQPAVGEGDPLAPSGRRHVRPPRVVRVLADERRCGRLERQELGQERVGARAEVGHSGTSTGCSGGGASLAVPATIRGHVRCAVDPAGHARRAHRAPRAVAP